MARLLLCCLLFVFCSASLVRAEGETGSSTASHLYDDLNANARSDIEEATPQQEAATEGQEIEDYETAPTPEDEPIAPEGGTGDTL